MVFSSAIFIFLFLPLVLVAYRFIPKKRIVWRNLFLFLVSSLFYFYGEQEKILLLYLVILVNYWCGRVVFTGTEDMPGFERKSRVQKLSLFFCVLFCVGLLWYFKYFSFTLEMLSLLFAGHLTFSDVRNIVLPLGISFYTFHVLSYTLDVYFGRMRAERNLLNFAAYVLMFPQLVAGPIVRYRDIRHQFYHRVVTGAGFANGIRRFFFGMAKKVLIANTVAIYVDQVFKIPPSQLTWADCWGGAVAYTLQIYFDFSGYSDMAIGLALLFGFHYKENFNYPYIARSAGEFWRRWHISLSTWLRDYIYIHIGGSRCSRTKTARNVLIVFLCSGLWHGANITFVNWGLLYGIFIVLENNGLKKYLQRNRLLSHVYLLLIAVTGWVIFRADNMGYAKEFIAKMYGWGFSGWGMTQPLELNIVAAMVAGIIFSCDWRGIYRKAVRFCAVRTVRYHRAFMLARVLSFVTAVGLFVTSVASIISSSHNPFIYFRF